MRSSGCSRPTESLTRPSETPISARSSGVKRWCVVVAGWVIRLLASPRLLEIRIRSRAFRKRKAPGLASLDLEGDQGRAARHLPGDDIGLRVIGAARIDQAADLGMSCQCIGDDSRRPGLALDAQGQRLQAFQKHPGIERRHRRSRLPEQRMNVGLDELLGCEDHAAKAAPLPVDVLSRRIDDAIGSELQRLLPDRRREHVVHHQLRPDLTGNRGDGLDVDDLQGRDWPGFPERRPSSQAV